MAFLDFGIYQGAAVKVPYESMFQQNLQIKQMERQARIDAENKAKLFTDDIEFGTAETEFNRGRLDEFYTGKMREIGKFMAENPDLAYNPAKQIQLKFIKRSLKDNAILSEDMAAKSEREALTKWLHDNPGSDRRQEVMDEIAKWDSYSKYGTTDVNSKEPQRYTFVDPDSKVNIGDAVMKTFGQVQATGQMNYGTHIEVYATAEDKRRAATTLLTDPSLRAVLNKQFQAIPEERRIKEFHNSLEEYAEYLGTSYIPIPNQRIVTDPNLLAKKGSSATGKTVNDGTLTQMVDRVSQTTADPFTGIQADSGYAPVIDALFPADKTGRRNLSEGRIMDREDPKNNKGAIGFTLERAALFAKANATPTGTVWKEGEQYMSEFVVELDINEYVAYMGGDAKTVDLKGLSQWNPGNYLSDYDNNEKWDIRFPDDGETEDPRRHFKVVPVTNEDGDTVYKAQCIVAMTVPINEATNALANTAVNRGNAQAGNQVGAVDKYKDIEIWDKNKNYSSGSVVKGIMADGTVKIMKNIQKSDGTYGWAEINM